jgi:hypothetical protein
VIKPVTKLILISFIFCSFPAVAHDLHPAVDFASVFAELVEHDFKIHPLVGNGLPSYVKLSDGSLIELDDEFWQTVQDLVSALEAADEADDHDHHSTSLIRRVRGRIGEFAQSRLWLEIGANGDEFFQRFGPVVMVTLVSAELFEHSFIPFPAFCVAIQAGCATWGHQMQELLNSARFRYPLDAPQSQRLAAAVGTIHWKYEFWRAMRRVSFGQQESRKVQMTPSGSLQQSLLASPFWAVLARPGAAGPQSIVSATTVARDDVPDFAVLDSSRAPLERFFSAQFRLAFYDLQLKWAKMAIESVARYPLAFLKLRRAISGQLRALDGFGLILRRLARLDSGGNAVHRRLIEAFDQRQRLFVSSFAELISAVEHGEPPSPDVYPQVFLAPEDTLRWLKEYQNTGALGLIDCQLALAGVLK